MKAIFSDIHANLEALQAVLADIAEHEVEAVYCLGDIVGYGPNPRECIDLVREHCKLSLLGNHDQGAIFDPSGFNDMALQAILWTRAQLEAPIPSRTVSEERWEFLGDLPRTYREENILYVHGSARNPINEYIFPEDIYSVRKMEQIYSRVERYGFQGHTHLPGIFVEQQAGDYYAFNSPEELDYVYRLTDQKTLCNVGSVGQPRDGDWRACYVLFDGQTIYYRRVEYDVETTIRKVHDEPDLNNFLGDRLRDGR